MMIHQVMEEDDAFDADVHEHLSILACLQKMHVVQLKKEPRRGGSKHGRKKSKPQQMMEVEGHTMLYTITPLMGQHTPTIFGGDMG
jgi:hypothetical protein